MNFSIWAGWGKEGYRKERTYCEGHRYLVHSQHSNRHFMHHADIPGPPNTRISSLELPPLSLMGIT